MSLTQLTRSVESRSATLRTAKACGPAWLQWAFLAWGCALALALPLAGGIEGRLETTANVSGSEHGAVRGLLRTRFATALDEPFILVASGLPAADSAQAVSLSEELRTLLSGSPFVREALSYGNTGDPLFLGESGRGAIVLVRPVRDGGTDEDVLRKLRTITDRTAAGWHERWPGLTLEWTGAAALNADMRHVSALQAQRAEAQVIPLVLLLLVVFFRSLVAALLPVLMGLLCIPITLAIAAVASRYTALSVVLVNVVTMLGLGLSIDYALLVVTRFREQLGQGQTPAVSARVARATAGRAIVLSAAGVAAGLVALFVVPINEIRSIAFAGLAVLAVAVLLAVTLLPVLLAAIGRHIDALTIRSARTRAVGSSTGTVLGGVTRLIFRRPAACLLAGLLPIGLLAYQGARLHIGIPQGEWLPASSASVGAVHHLADLGRPDLAQLIDVIVRLPPGVRADGAAGLDFVERIAAPLRRDARVGAVRTLSESAPVGSASTPTRRTERGDSVQVDTGARADLTRLFASTDRSLALIAVIPAAGTDPAQLTQLVRDLRARPVTVMVGGLPALNVDYEDAVRQHSAMVVAIVIAASFAMLVLGFGSLVIALKAVLLNVLSVAAAFGALVLVFQDGNAVAGLALSQPTASVFPNIPILAFCIVYGLSMDYEVFLFDRVVEAHRSGESDVKAMSIGLQLTAWVIASAALIMIIVFGAFCLGDFLFIRMLGFTLAVAILIDATVVRLLLGPAAFALAGRWNWWHGVPVKRSG